MSYCFRVEGVGVPTYEDVLGDIAGIDLRCQTGATLAGPWRPGHEHRLYIYGVSTRSVEAVLDGHEFRVRLFSGACHEDYELGLQIISAVARLVNRPIISEEGVRFLAEERRRGYGRGWVDDHIRTIAKVILRMAASKRAEDPVAIDGPIRPYVIGPKIADLVRAEGQTDLDRAEKLIQRIRRLQYLSVPMAPIAATKLPDSEKLVSSSVLEPGRTMVFERVDVIAVSGGAPVYVPWSHLDTLMGPFVYWLDEWTALLRAVPEASWPEVMAQAEQLEAASGDVNSENTQHTWWSTQITDAPTEDLSAPEPRVAESPEDSGVRQWWDIWRQRR